MTELFLGARLCANVLPCYSFRVQLLQCPHVHFTSLQRRNPFGGGAGGGESGDRWNASSNGGSRQHVSENMNEKPDHAHSSLSETMTARIEINELGNPARHPLCERFLIGM